MTLEGLDFWTVLLDSAGLLICIGTVLAARRAGGKAVPAAAPAFQTDVHRETLRQQVAASFAAIIDGIDAQRQSLDTLLAGDGDAVAPVSPASVPAAAARRTAAPPEDFDAALARMADQGLAVDAIAAALQRPQCEVSLRLKLLRRGGDA